MSGALRLRVAMVWCQTLHAEHLLAEPRAVVLGYGADALFPLPEAEARRGDVTLLTPSEHGYTLYLPVDAGGALWLHGERYDVQAIRARAPSIELARGDYGVVSLGAASYFFQQVRAPEPARRALGSLDGEAALSFGLSLFMHAMLIGLMFLAEYAHPYENTLDVRPELAARVAAATLTRSESPVPLVDDEGETPTPDAPSTVEAPKRADKRTPRASRRSPTLPPNAVGDPAARIRGLGLLGAIAGKNSLQQALRDDSVGALLGGLGAARASAGSEDARALRGVGAAAAGGQGTLLGGGPIGTGTGSAGRGATRTGAGAAGGQARGELKVAVTPGAPQVSGFLSAEQINRVVRANQAALRYCYESEVQRQRGLKGKVVLQWRVDRAGAVPDARVATSTLRNATVEGCMVRQVKKWRFPQPNGGEVAVVYPFIFGVGE